MELKWIPLVLAVSILASSGNTLLKIGASALNRDRMLKGGRLLEAVVKPMIITGLLLYVVSQILWIAELKFVDLSLAYPLQVGLNFLLINSVAWLSLKEPFSPGKLTGIILIFGGVFTVATG
jgi:multidrug transporter EmrE-like cation transporter